ncbi:MAG: hypothetical protein K2M87_04010 [Muribaculaceae bacterium]|nr:hypothetical protein [Muribaculaceae bacterium]
MSAVMFICMSALISCKPTEANYKAAYDSALLKREQAAKEQMRPATGLLSDDGPQLRVVDGDSIYVDHTRLLLEDGSPLKNGKWAVVVGKFKMDTNAKSSAEALKKAGFSGAVMAKANGGRYFAVAATFEKLDSAKIESHRFMKTFPDYPFIGLPGKPILINY